MTLGLAEVEERLRALRRRLNSATVQHCAYLSLSALLLTLAGFIVLGLRVSPATFRIITWGAGLLSIGIVAGCVVFLRRSLLDLLAAARVADRQGQLTDRLATVMDLRVRPRVSRLAPVLVAQTLALGMQWHPQHIAPRRVPRSIFLAVASLLILASTVFLSRHAPSPPPAAATAGDAGAAGPMNPANALKAPLGAMQDFANSQPGDEADLPSSQPMPTHGEVSTSGKADESSGAPHPDSGGVAALPDRLQDAIRRAFHAEVTDRPRQLAMQSDRTTGDSGERADAGRGERGSREPRSADARNDGSEKPASRSQGSQQGTATGQQKRPDGTGQSKGERLGQRRDPDAPNQHLDSSSPAAGDGSSPGGLMGGQATAFAAAQEGAKTFKLTITSFLRAVEQKAQPPRRMGKRKGAAAAAAAGGQAGEASLSDRQLNDDALRKAEIPPEFEDIVRRVYSARAEP